MTASRTVVTNKICIDLTVQCARCHNHKFDPVTQTDYYRMQAVFAERFADGDIPDLHTPIKKLSDRELEVFRLLGQGYETRRVAQSLNVSIKTVQAYCARIKEKLHLANASELLREAIRFCDAQSAG